MNITDDIISIKGVGEKTASCFHKLNIFNIRDLIFHIPRSFTLYEEPVIPTSNDNGETKAVRVYFKMNSFSSVKKGHLNISHVTAVCNGKNIYLSIFNMPYLKKQLKSDTEYVIRGTLEVGKQGAFSMLQPAIFTYDQYEAIAGTLLPQYPLVKGLTNSAVTKAVRQVIDVIDIPDDGLIGDNGFASALRSIHFPQDMDGFIKARKRIVFHEFVSFLLQMRSDDNNGNIAFNEMMVETAQTTRLLEALPYKLTDAQQRCWDDILKDMTSGKCMNRMIQGDVGSGKTIIAFLALILNASNAHQGCLMAPTEVLAKQHFENLCELNERFGIGLNPVLLLGSMSTKAKNENYKKIENGEHDVIIGTHAVFQKKVRYKDLTLVITDEQHRFGVKQRESIIEKGDCVHLMVMSATPIPRSLAMIIYGDTSISVIDEMPGNRIPIKNAVVGRGYRRKAYEFIKDEVQKGNQAYVICPQVEEGEDSDLENVVDYAAKLEQELGPEINIAYLHGKMSTDMKNRIMSEFKDQNIDVLVSTTVIEVGIDVKNATVMLIENAERFGLAQLHQLRGRVGRGDKQSYCIFMTAKEDDKTNERLNVLKSTNDGFKIADEDLRLRGPGDLFGIRQSGEFGFLIGDIYNDADVLREADLYVQNIMKPENADELARVAEGLNDTCFNRVDFRTI